MCLWTWVTKNRIEEKRIQESLRLGFWELWNSAKVLNEDWAWQQLDEVEDNILIWYNLKEKETLAWNGNNSGNREAAMGDLEIASEEKERSLFPGLLEKLS